VLAAQQWLASQLNVALEQVKIINIEQAQWSDSCLGLGKPNESCAQVITPGWKAVFEVNGTTYEVRTDESGSDIRLALPEGTPGAATRLENTPWNLVSFGPQGAEKALVEGSMISLLLANGQAGGFGGCNAYGGTYQVEADKISFHEIIRTEKACADNQVTEQEQQYFQALQSAAGYELDGNTLHITYDDGNGVLVFEAAVQAIPTPTVGTPGG
jgi:heat shock protein HslJ